MRAKVCVPVAASTTQKMLEMIRRAEEHADIIEIRFDALLPGELSIALEAVRSTRPLIATFRPPEQGGLSAISRSERAEFWGRDLSRFWAIDIEEDLLSLNIDHPNKIASYHTFDTSPRNLVPIIERLLASDASIVKIAATVNDAVDAVSVWGSLNQARDAGKQVIPIAMGEAGKWTRVLGPAYGGAFTYASLDSDSGTADGQITIKEMLDVYRLHEIDRDTAVYGVIGDPIGTSRSPQIHNAAFADQHLNAVFLPLQVRDIGAFFTRMIAPETREAEINFQGFAVTMPHKTTVMGHLDELHETADAIGAVNTIKLSGGRAVGYNTDAAGFIGPLRMRMGDLRNSRVAVLGAGGAAKACVRALENEGADVTIFARDTSKSSGAREITVLKDGATNFDILVNATPIGMSVNNAEFPLTHENLAGVRLVYDLVTRDGDTPLIAMAKQLNIENIDGFEMLVEQAAKQFEIWTGLAAPVEVMKAAIR